LDQLGATPFQRGLVLVAWVVGQIAGLAASGWVWSRIHPLRLMVLCSAGCAVAYAAWLGVSWLPASALLLLLSGFFGSALFPVVTAQAYAALPGRSTTVSAIAAVTAVGELLMPVLIGLAADHWGLRTALALLLLEPVGLGIVAAAVLARGRGSGRRA
ncbi:MAG TPA: MFS transporter, partial [Myxococcales bacterium]|nr:MFS transporter [Myxococcales bacterium]